MLREVNVLTWKAPSLVLYDNSRVIVRKTSYGTAGKGAVLLCKVGNALILSSFCIKVLTPNHCSLQV